MNLAYSRLSTTHGHITDCKLDSVVYAARMQVYACELMWTCLVWAERSSYRGIRMVDPLTQILLASGILHSTIHMRYMFAFPLSQLPIIFLPVSISPLLQPL